MEVKVKDYEAAVAILKDMEKICQVLEIPPFPIYFLGGSACILGKYTDRATRDFDLVDLQYSASYGRALRYLIDFDMLEYESTILAPSYKNRATRLEQFNYLQIYILSREDIIVSKIVRMEQKDIEDIDMLIVNSDKIQIQSIIDEILNRKDLFESKRQALLKKLSEFREKYNV
jgi:hypothetical protein